MSTSQVPVWVPLVVAFVGALVTFAGVVVTAILTSRRDEKRWNQEMDREKERWAREQEVRAEARNDRRRQELAEAIAVYASSVTALRRAEFDRGKKRLSQAPEKDRELARQETYRLRAEAESKAHLVSLLSDQQNDRRLVTLAELVIELCHRISAGTGSESELHERKALAKAALQELIVEASQRVQSN
jgi:hypothetical protein